MCRSELVISGTPAVVACDQPTIQGYLPQYNLCQAHRSYSASRNTKIINFPTQKAKKTNMLRML